MRPSAKLFDFLNNLIIRTANLSRYTGRPELIKQSPHDKGVYAIGITLGHITIDYIDQFHTMAKVEIATANREFAATGIGLAVKGRSDRYSAGRGAKEALKRALASAFNILGQMDKSAGIKLPKKYRTAYFDVEILINEMDSTGLGPLDDMLNGRGGDRKLLHDVETMIAAISALRDRATAYVDFVSAPAYEAGPLGRNPEATAQVNQAIAAEPLPVVFNKP